MSLDLVKEFIQETQPQGEMPNGEAVTPENNEQGGSGEMPNQETSTQTQEQPTEEKPAVSQTETVQQPQIDWGLLSARSGGLFNDETTFNSVLEKAKQYDDVSTKYKELESNQFKPANDFVSNFNKLVADGASIEQQKAFIELNQVGDLSTLSPREILITKDMLLNGASREVAEFNLNHAYDTVGLEEDSVEYKALMHRQQVDSKSAMNELSKYKSEISVVKNEAKDLAEQERLKSIQENHNRMEFVKQEAPKLAQSFSGKLSFDLGEGKTFEHNFGDDFKKDVESKVVGFFETTGLALNQENLGKVSDFLEAQYIIQNKDSIIKDMHNKLESQLREEFANKYQNVSGLPHENQNPRPSASTMGKSEREIQDAAAKKMGLI